MIRFRSKTYVQILSSFNLVLALLIWSGCKDDSSEKRELKAALSIKVENPAIPKSVAVADLSVDEAKALLKSVQFKNALLEDSLDYKTGSFIVNFDLSGGITTVAVGTVPAGSYDEVRFKIHKPEDNQVVADPEFKIGTSGDERFSFIIKGQYNNQSFVYRSSKSMSEELDLVPPLVVSDQNNSVNITILIDVSKWFIDPQSGATLDPTYPQNENIIDDNIKDSFKAFKDNDKDGLEEDESDDNNSADMNYGIIN